MKGVINIKVSNRFAKFDFTLYRNITIINGDSGTGKTTLYSMITDYTRLKDKSGVNISCSKNCVALVEMDWKHQLKNIKDSIVFIDEGFEGLYTKELAKSIKNSDNYYVIFTREPLHEIPYSVEEIYEIKTSGKFHKLKKVFQSNDKHFYSSPKRKSKINPDMLLTEDSKSGLQFYTEYFKDTAIECKTANSNSSIFDILINNIDKNVLVVADGAAFGSEIDRILKIKSAGEFMVCLPESFEWLILKSGLIKDIENILSNPSEYIESTKYFSWENFFESYLVQVTKNTIFKYKKSSINKVYLIKENADLIVAEIFTENLPYKGK